MKTVVQKSNPSNWAYHPAMGLTPTELHQYFGDYVMELFGNWVDGAVCKQDDNGTIYIPTHDIGHFMQEGLGFPRWSLGYDKKPQ